MLEIERSNPMKMDTALQLERVARQYSAHRELVVHTGEDTLWEPYTDSEEHLQFFAVTPRVVFAERVIMKALVGRLKDQEYATSLIGKYLLPGDVI